MTDAVNRYNFSQKIVTQAINFLKGTGKIKPNFLNKFDGIVKKRRLFLNNKLVVPKEKIDNYLRSRIYNARTPLTRDGAFYAIFKDAVGVSRAAIDRFLKKQRIIRETDNQQSTSKRVSRKVHKKGHLHYDLIEIKFKDLPFIPEDLPEEKAEKDKTEEEKAEGEEDPVHKGYIFSMVDALTSLSFFKFHPFKTHKYVTPIAKQAFEFFSKMLKMPMNKFIAFSDSGKEFNWKQYNEWGVKTRQLRRSSIVENKNSHLQRVLYKLAKMKKTKNLSKLIKDAQKVVNRTQSSLTKKSPLENTKEMTTNLTEKYNKKRGKGSGIKIHRRVLVPKKDFVRIQLLFNKDKAFYKAYHGKMWSKITYRVQAKRGNTYKVNKKFRHRDELRLTENYDIESERLLDSRK